MTTTATRPTISRWDRRRDKYGRVIHVPITVEGGEYGVHGLVGHVVSMPKVYRDHFPGDNYLVNCWGKGPDASHGEITFHPTLTKAKSYFAANALTRGEYVATRTKEA